MKYRINQKNGDELSILGFGCMRLPTKAGIIDERRATKMIRDSIEKGVNYFDTAYIYHAGQSETVAVRQIKSDKKDRPQCPTVGQLARPDLAVAHYLINFIL